MTDLQKLKIQNLRQENYSFAKIAETLQMKESTIKSYCQRHGIKTPDIPRKSKAEKAELSICRYCGKKLENPWNRIGKVFCSDNCRTAFHNEEKRLKRLNTSKKGPISPGKAPETAGLPGPRELSSEGQEVGSYANHTD